MSFTGVISQSNGTQGRTTIGPKKVDHKSPSKHGDNMSYREIELQLDGDLAPANVVDFEDQTQYAFPKGCFITDVLVYSETGIAALNLGVVDIDANGSDTNVLAGVAVAAAGWLKTVDVDLAVAAVAQLEFNGLAAGETGSVLIRFVQATHDSQDGGVLAKYR